MSFNLVLVLGLVLMAFFAEYLDSSLGMGYGTSLTPLLLVMGFSPAEVVPAILLSEILTGILAGFTHHQLGNVDFSIGSGNRNERITIKNIRSRLSDNTKMMMIIASCSVIGATSSVFIAIKLSEYLLKMYIGILVLLIGLYILYSRNRTIQFSWHRLIGMSVLASFNKGLSGGGYGPVVTGGQILSGVNVKNAVGITSMAEALTCIVGLLVYLTNGVGVEWRLAACLMTGGLLSVPFAALTVSKIKLGQLKVLIGATTVCLGLFTIAKVIS